MLDSKTCMFVRQTLYCTPRDHVLANQASAVNKAAFGETQLENQLFHNYFGITMIFPL